MWNLDDILLAVTQALQAEHARLTAEQAVHNIDALDELEMHPLIAAALAGLGVGVLREQVYPGEWVTKPGRRRAALPDDAQRQRADFVLTPAPGQQLADPLRQKREQLARAAEREGTLFDAPGAAPEPAPVPEGVAPDDACWLELKVVGQFCHTAGVPGPNRVFASQLLRGPVEDLRKLGHDPMIVHAGLVLVLFAQNDEVARHDVGVLVRRSLDRHVLAALPRIATFPILDRIGNSTCLVAIFEPVRERD